MNNKKQRNLKEVSLLVFSACWLDTFPLILTSCGVKGLYLAAQSMLWPVALATS